MDDSLNNQNNQAEDFDQTDSERKLPAIFDIWLYPANPAGFFNIFFFVGVTAVLELLSHLIICVGFLMKFLIIPLGLYYYWYFADCVRSSAEGRMRAPDPITSMDWIEDYYVEMLQIFLTLCVFWGPLWVYYAITDRRDDVFFALLIWGAVLFPMGLLGVIMEDSISALNPFRLIWAIIKTLIPYSALVILSMALIYAIALIAASGMNSKWGFLALAVELYLILIFAHILGRFYYRYAYRIGWED